MRFLRRYQYLLCFMGILVLASILVVHQFMANESAHIKLRENFILLHDEGKAQACDEVYQQLIQNLERLDERALVDDLQRTSLLVDARTQDVDNLVWKYHVSVKKEVQQRAERRVADALQADDGNPEQ
jgi:hypothetical protein